MCFVKLLIPVLSMDRVREMSGSKIIMNEPQSQRKRRREYSKHGLTAMKSALYKPGAHAIDGRTKVGRALAEWREELVADIGGESAISTQQLAIIDLAVKTKLLPSQAGSTTPRA